MEKNRGNMNQRVFTLMFQLDEDRLPVLKEFLKDCQDKYHGTGYSITYHNGFQRVTIESSDYKLLEQVLFGWCS
jgi:hypothetical protein